MTDNGSIRRMGLATTLLLACSVMAGLLVRNSLRHNGATDLVSLAGALAACLLYPCVGALVVLLCEELQGWAYMGERKVWGRRWRIVAGAVWPVTLLICLIKYIFLGIVNRFY